MNRNFLVYALTALRVGIVLCMTAVCIYAQPADWRFRPLGTADGLSQSTVSRIYQDSRGLMWFGTRNGLNRYDGYTFTIYKNDPADTASISNNIIRDIVEDADGNLWIATEGGGVNRFDRRRETFTRYGHDVNNPQSLASNVINALTFDVHGRLWIATEDQGLDRLDPRSGAIRHYMPDANNTHSLAGISVRHVLEDSRGNLWIAVIGGLHLYRPETDDFEILRHDPHDPGTLTSNEVWYLFEDSRQVLWAGTYGGGVNYLDLTTRRLGALRKNTRRGPALAHDYILSISEDADGHVWIGTENEGICIYDRATNTVQQVKRGEGHDTNLSNNSIDCLYRDAKGNMWVGTYAGGVNFFSDATHKFNHYQYHPDASSLSHNTVSVVYEDSRSNLWVGTDGGGLNLFDRARGTFRHFRHTEATRSIGSDYILSLCEAPDGTLWMGTWGAGITRLDPRTGGYTYFRHQAADSNTISSNNTWALCRDSDDNMWVGSFWGGLDLYLPQQQAFRRVADIPNITVLVEDRQGYLWAGSDGMGLVQFDRRQGRIVQHFRAGESSGLTNNHITSLHEGDDCTLWIGTLNGLHRLDATRTHWQQYSTPQGLPDEGIAGIQEDAKGYLWISTNQGIARFDPATRVFRNYTVADGLQSAEFRPGASCRTRSGTLCFGGVNGYNEFHPDAMADVSYDPPIIFTAFRVMNQSAAIAAPGEEGILHAAIGETQTIRLPYNQSVLSFEVASLNYTHPEKKRYAYRLEGFDAGWNDIGARNTITYTNLDPGTYTLYVRSQNNEGVWSARMARLEIIVTPPFWKTWWFRVALFVFLSSVVCWIFYRRLAGIRARNRLLQEEVARRTQELTESNASLLERNEEVRLQNETLELLNGEITRQSDKILRQQERIVDQNHTLEQTVQALEESNRTKDRFFSILAHDLKNPVQALAGISELVRERFTTLSPAALYEQILHISRSAASVHQLLVDLLDWGRTQSRNVPHTPSDIRLHDLVLDNTTLLEEQLRQKSLTLTVDVDTSLGVHADYRMLDTVVRNLLSNAVKFTPAGGCIAIAAAQQAEAVALSITDTGVGILPEQLEQWCSGVQQSTPGTDGETGTGLGLLLCREFIAANQGTLAVHSVAARHNAPQGTCFTITLPPARLAPSVATAVIPAVPFREIPQPPHKPVNTRRLQGRRVLIVDDNAEVRNYLRLLLSDTFGVVEAADGAAAIKIAMEEQPAVIISDMIMPVMNGADFCARIKNNLATCHIPVIMLTSQGTEQSELLGYEAGADAYLTKPVRRQALFQLIVNFLLHQENLRQWFEQGESLYPEGHTVNHLDEAFLQKVVAFVEDNLSDQSLDHTRISELTNMSRTVLYAKFKALTGQGVHDFIRTIRMKKGLALLLGGELNITQIAYEIGFNTPSYFTKTFVKHYGMTPKDYVTSLKKGAGKTM
ncbi:hybrid sensor histidine kinase/response regulator transcription factor [Parachryseolinea silvisoli]|uniref:hybrid sensor histidine kinase/response regulator transcription factor n=1 Tax=Parachryseolinea silvisoli TaxID=2873601 RepID=UPI002265DBDE|nr:hybrid sensor histidine kinase/response regulator transcription factor [Parachryseolinea silvisoli]MCD9019895.1 response regulator [Parachryseolinea silvisoli]